MPVKTEKAKLLHHLEAGVELMTTPTNEPVAHVIDGNASLYVLSPIPDNFHKITKVYQVRFSVV